MVKKIGVEIIVTSFSNVLVSHATKKAYAKAYGKKADKKLSERAEFLSEHYWVTGKRLETI